MKILLADDNPEVRSALRLLLEQEFLPSNVVEAADIQALLGHMSSDCPVVLLLDWELPRLHHDDILTAVRASCPQTKVIALSSKFEARQEALAARVDAFVGKTEPPERILVTLRSFIPNITNEQPG